MKKILSLFLFAASALSLASCGGLEDEFLDNSFVYIADGTGQSSAVIKDQGVNPSVSTTLWVTLSMAKKDLDATIEVYYEAIPDGIIEGVDYTIKTESVSPLKFVPGNEGVPLRITWIHNTGNEGTLTFKLTGSNLSYLRMGDPKMSASNNKSTFVFTKQASGN